MDGLLLLLWVLTLTFIVWLYIYLPATMAQKRNRNPFIWVLISLVGSPILAVLLLIAVGKASCGHCCRWPQRDK